MLQEHTPQVDTKKDEALDIYQQVIRSGVLGKSQRQAKLLKSLLLNRAEEPHQKITETRIAIDLFDRDTSFDPTADSVVRVEMHRLRKNLSIFNTLSDVQLELPRASYQILVSNTSTPEQTEKPVRSPAPLKPLLSIATLVLCVLAAAFIWTQATEDQLPPLSDNSRPSVRLSIELSNLPLNKKMDENLTQILNADIGLDLSISEDSDYKVVIKDGNHAVLIELWSGLGKLVHSQSFDISQIDQKQILDKMEWLIRYEFLQDSKSKMVLDYASASWVDPRKKQIHRCLSDAQSFIVGEPLYYLKPEELPTCLSKIETATDNEQDKARSYIDLALLSMQQARGYADLHIENPTELALLLTSKAEKILGPHRQVMINRIYYHWLSGVQPDKTEELLQTSKRLFPIDPSLANMWSVTHALYLNDFDSIDPTTITALSLLKETNFTSSIAAIPLAQNILDDNEELAFFWLSKLNSLELPYSVWGLAIACKYNKTQQIDEYRGDLLQGNAQGTNAAAEIVRSFNYSSELTKALSQPLEECSSPESNL